MCVEFTYTEEAIPYVVAYPTVAPTVPPTRAPSRIPTLSPTRTPTAMPTSSTTITFVVNQVIYGITYTTYMANEEVNMIVIKLTITNMITGITTENIYNFVVYATSSRRMLTDTPLMKPLDSVADAINCTYQIIYTADTPGVTATTLENQLRTAIASGSFDAALHSYAAQYNATDLSNTTAGAISFTILAADAKTKTTPAPLGMIIGIVIGAIVLLAILFRALTASSTWFWSASMEIESFTPVFLACRTRPRIWLRMACISCMLPSAV